MIRRLAWFSSLSKLNLRRRLKMKLCVIGAGAAGLISIKHGIDFGCDVTAFDQMKTIGGLWNFTDDVGTDKYGLDVHSSLYKNLYTNLPIEVMCYPDHPFPDQKESFVHSDEVLKYYQNFSNKYKLHKVIKFEHSVLRVRRVKQGWEVIVKNLQKGSFETYTFDVVLVCSGHFHSGCTPAYEGIEIFKGKQFHSHDYRCADLLKNESILVIGGAYSGVDIVQESSKFAKNVMWSHHLADKPSSSCFNSNVEQKPDVRKLTENGAEYVDGTTANFSVIIYCTGYEYKFPFLSVDCGVSTGDKFVKPLYMHCLSINEPTLGIIGLPNLICPNPMFDLQVRFCLTFMTGKKKLPSREEMLKEFEDDLEERNSRGMGGKKTHYMGQGIQDKYYIELAEKANITPIYPCIPKMHSQCLVNRKADFSNFRKIKFHIVDENNFTMSKIE